MTPTDELHRKLRRLIDEVIPLAGTDADTRFSDDEITDLLEEHDSLNAAAADGWRRKAARALSDRGGLIEMSAGSERMKWVSPEAYRAHCLDMATYFEGKLPGAGSRLFELWPRDVLGTIEDYAERDLSRLA